MFSNVSFLQIVSLMLPQLSTSTEYVMHPQGSKSGGSGDPGAIKISVGQLITSQAGSDGTPHIITLVKMCSQFNVDHGG